MRNAAKNLLRTNAITKAEHDDVLGMDKKGPDAKDFLRELFLAVKSLFSIPFCVSQDVQNLLSCMPEVCQRSSWIVASLFNSLP